MDFKFYAFMNIDEYRTNIAYNISSSNIFEIVSFQLEERETQLPSLKIQLDRIVDPNFKFGALKENGTVGTVFFGYISKFCNDSKVLYLICMVENLEEQIKRLNKNAIDKIGSNILMNTKQATELNGCIYYADPSNGELSYNDYVFGQNIISCNDILSQSINVKKPIVHEDYNVLINIRIEWVRRGIRKIDIWQDISDNNGVVSTYTPANFINSIQDISNNVSDIYLDSVTYKGKLYAVSEKNKLLFKKQRTNYDYYSEVRKEYDSDGFKIMDFFNKIEFPVFHFKGSAKYIVDQSVLKKENLCLDIRSGDNINLHNRKELHYTFFLEETDIPKWLKYCKYLIGQKIIFQDIIYECNKSHTNKDGVFDNECWSFIKNVDDNYYLSEKETILGDKIGIDLINKCLRIGHSAMRAMSRNVDFSFICPYKTNKHITLKDNVKINISDKEYIGKVKYKRTVVKNNIQCIYFIISCVNNDNFSNSFDTYIDKNKIHTEDIISFFSEPRYQFRLFDDANEQIKFIDSWDSYVDLIPHATYIDIFQNQNHSEIQRRIVINVNKN